MKKKDRVVYVELTKLTFPDKWKNGRDVTGKASLCGLCRNAWTQSSCASRGVFVKCGRKVVRDPLSPGVDCAKFELLCTHECTVDILGLFLQGLIYDSSKVEYA